ncbi:hypothetical protein ANAPRD1_00832 [Anaplasma phagocytophilum]|nr:hypothetical protein ANAPH1_00389 [Anaplasma phagocytophilum]SCV64676.1 hypothetical protein ANAPH2_01031 [Anaplasma phagocytophilum]SCV65377.1 hypothetical protein ANAPRD1_00832 [Anaplasma phagocytophilum]
MVKAEWSAENNTEHITPSLDMAFLIQFCSSALCFLDIAPESAIIESILRYKKVSITPCAIVLILLMDNQKLYRITHS